jgi:hypothetical protein
MIVKTVYVIFFLIFFAGCFGVYAFGEKVIANYQGQTSGIEQVSFSGYVGGAIGSGLIASSALLSVVYFICNYNKKNRTG